MPAEPSIYFFLTIAWQIFKNWWWVPLPFILWKRFLFFYLWWRVEGWLMKQKVVLLEIKLPKEVLKPIRAMEQVMASIHAAVFHPPDPWEKWIDGQVQLSIHFEVASIGGETHFFVRTPVNYREAVESSLYSQYPEIEILEADDYTKYVPQSIPNKEWDMWGADYKLLKDDHYPIKTYAQFETEQERLEEKKIDPVASLLEAMAKVKPGEQLWLQMSAEPTAVDPETKFKKWLEDGALLRDKLARRPGPSPAPGSIIQEAAEILITGKVPEEKKEKEEIIPPEMKLTPGEKEALSAIENKMSKPCFNVNIRFIWLGMKEVWFKPKFRLAFTFFNEFMTLNLNGLVPYGPTVTKIKKKFFLPINLLRARRHYVRCRRMFRNYIKRFTPYFPKPSGISVFVLNTEELASLFHFPSQATAPAPGVSRIEAKKGGVPPELPVE